MPAIYSWEMSRASRSGSPGSGSVSAAAESPAWDAVGGASSYTLYWGLTSMDYFWTATGITDTNYPKASMGLDPGVTYYWAVTAIVGGVESEWSAESTIVG